MLLVLIALGLMLRGVAWRGVATMSLLPIGTMQALDIQEVHCIVHHGTKMSGMAAFDPTHAICHDSPASGS